MLQPSATVSFIVKCYFLKFFFFKKNRETIHIGIIHETGKSSTITKKM